MTTDQPNSITFDSDAAVRRAAEPFPAGSGSVAAAPVASTPAEPHGVVHCDNDSTPHSRNDECVNPWPAKWTPGAGVELLKREHPEMVPEASAEDLAAADRIIASLPHDGRVLRSADIAQALGADVRAAYERGKAEGYRDGILEGRRRAVAIIEDHSEVNADIYRRLILGEETGGSDA